MYSVESKNFSAPKYISNTWAFKTLCGTNLVFININYFYDLFDTDSAWKIWSLMFHSTEWDILKEKHIGFVRNEYWAGANNTLSYSFIWVWTQGHSNEEFRSVESNRLGSIWKARKRFCTKLYPFFIWKEIHLVAEWFACGLKA